MCRGIGKVEDGGPSVAVGFPAGYTSTPYVGRSGLYLVINQPAKMSEINRELDAKWERAKKLFVEDDVSYPGKEGGEQAWKRLFGEPLPGQWLAKSDHGDAMYFEYPGGRLYCLSYDGAEIRVLE
jgi:hypothetical protein